MGNETRFQSFPAHLHKLLSVTLDDLGWYIHTKVYPKFKTRYNISVATAGFSKWLVQSENPGTDAISLSHSMGGILAAEVVLLRNERRGFRHRILGLSLSLFLGMHPGVIFVGLGSFFFLGRKDRVLPRRMVQPRVEGCMRVKIRVWLRC